MDPKKIEKLQNNKPEMLKVVTEEYLTNHMDKERLKNIFDSLDTFIADGKNYDSIKDCCKQAIQADLSAFLQEIFEALGYDEMDTYQLITGNKGDGSGILIYQGFNEKQVDKVLDLLLEAWIEEFGKEILTKICEIKFYN